MNDIDTREYDNICDVNDHKNLNKSDNTYVACFKLDDYVKDIICCYKNNDSIISQLEQDYHRQTIIIDKQKLKTSELFIDHIQTHLCYNKSESFCGLTYELLILLLCCQSSFGMPFEVIRNIYVNDENHYLISRRELCKMKTSIELNDVTTITSETTFFIICMHTEKIIAKFPVSLTIHLSENNDFSMALMSWSHIIV